MKRNLTSLAARLVAAAWISAGLAAVVSAAPAANAATLPFSLKLPVDAGATVWSAGPHISVSGTIRNGVDFRNPDRADGTRADLRVRAAASGKVTYNNGCVIQVDHSSGYKIQYAHMKTTNVAVGTSVSAGTYLGTTGTPQETCGSGSGSHLHFSLWSPSGSPVAISGTSMGGYTVRANGSNYCGYWTRDSDGRTVVPQTCSTAPALVNGTTSEAPAPTKYPTLKYGNTGSNVKALQYLLRFEGFWIDPDGSFGPATQNAVIGFQKKVGLSQTGVADHMTISKAIDTVYYGDVDQAAAGAQVLLKKHGYYGDVIDGSFGDNSLNALHRFQSAKGITRTNYVNGTTWLFLFN